MYHKWFGVLQGKRDGGKGGKEVKENILITPTSAAVNRPNSECRALSDAVCELGQ